MGIEPVGVLFAALAIVMTIARRGRLDWAICLGLAFPYGWIVTIGEDGLTGSFVVGIIAGGVLLLRLARPDRPVARQRKPGLRLLVAFFAYAVLVTLIAPGIFQGIPALPNAGTRELFYLTPGVLTYAPSNWFAIAYLAINVIIVLYMATTGGVTAAPLGAAFAIAILLSAARIITQLLGLPWVDGFFDNLRGGVLIDGGAAGVTRYRGIFTEPAALSGGALATVGFFVAAYAETASRRVRAFSVLVIVAAGFCLVMSTSSTAVIAGLVLAGLVVCYRAGGFLFRRRPLHPALLLGALAALIVAIATVDRWFPLLTGSTEEKLGTISFQTRTGANLHALTTLLNTFGIGSGMGSNVTYGLWANLLASVGIIGTALFLALVFTLIKHAYPVPGFRAPAWALISFLVAAFVSGTQIYSPFIWLPLAILAHAAWNKDEPDERLSALGSTTRRARVGSVTGAGRRPASRR